ncbi:endonuclease NucS domain-containing protein [Glycomyces amatae]|nr:endonuclease NucS domain-containing protein [Glycomyces amatae]
MRLPAARCQVDCTGRPSARLPMATRLIIWKADGSD